MAAIGAGLLVLVAAGTGDGPDAPGQLAGKVARLRIFADSEGRMNRSLLDVAGEALVVSQFTLYADVRRGNRPGFTDAAPGRFGAHMHVGLVNDGPVTIWLDWPPRAPREV